MNFNEFNFIDPAVPQKFVELLMGPFEESDGQQIPLTPDMRLMAHILHKVNFFSSVGEARRNGWDKPIPPGFSKFEVGKGKKMRVIFILADHPIWH